jgi:uncharacterized protein YutE (UPF0331/DUF86 family)
MIIKDSNEIPKDDYTNILKLTNLKIINPSLSKKLKEINGLRNRIAHDYNGLDDIIAIKSIINLLDSIHEFEEEIKKWLMTT